MSFKVKSYIQEEIEDLLYNCTNREMNLNGRQIAIILSFVKDGGIQE